MTELWLDSTEPGSLLMSSPRHEQRVAAVALYRDVRAKAPHFPPVVSARYVVDCMRDQGVKYVSVRSLRRWDKAGG